MNQPKNIDHLFRTHAGKMVSVLTRIFGLSNLEIIEDAVQDAFVKASILWRKEIPENPEAWLNRVAKNRVIDIFRKLKKQTHLADYQINGTDTIAIHDLFLDDEIEDAQLRMIFTACHPKLDARDRIAFALKTVSGFSGKEIASALLINESTIRKRLFRARTVIQKEKITFTIPQGKSLLERLNSVLEVLYLIFNEGFHSNQKEQLVKKELCGEAIRLCKLLLKNKHTNTSNTQALFALMCFHAARLDAKSNSENEIFDLKTQDRSLWYFPLIQLGNAMMHKAVENNEFSHYHYEAAIAGEHLKANTFEETNWDKILFWYQKLNEVQSNPIHYLTMSLVCMQLNKLEDAEKYLNKITVDDFQQRKYLYYGTEAEYFIAKKDLKRALSSINLAIENVTNQHEKKHLETKKEAIKNLTNF